MRSGDKRQRYAFYLNCLHESRIELYFRICPRHFKEMEIYLIFPSIISYYLSPAYYNVSARKHCTIENNLH